MTAASYPELHALSAPVRFRGPVIRGFGRGSKTLGVPTANLDPSGRQSGAELDLPPGIYFGFASVGAAPEVYKMVMSIGWYVAGGRGAGQNNAGVITLSIHVESAAAPSCRNPFFKNEKKTLEPHLLHVFKDDFYGEELRLVVTGYLRPEKNFGSLEELMAAIHADINAAREALAGPVHAAAEADPYLVPHTADVVSC